MRIPSMPDSKIPKSVKVPSYPATEREGIIWVWPGDPAKCSLDVGFPEPAPEWNVKGWKATDQPLDQDYSYWCLLENLLDPGRKLRQYYPTTQTTPTYATHTLIPPLDKP